MMAGRHGVEPVGAHHDSHDATWVKKPRPEQLPATPGEPLPRDEPIGGELEERGLRSTPQTVEVWIFPVE